MEETPKVQMKKDSEVIDARSSSKNSEVADNTLSSLSKKKSKKENKDEVPETTTGGSCLELVDDVSSKKKKKRNEGEEDVGKQKRKSQTIDTAEESNQNKVVESVEIDSISNNLESVEVSESSSQKKKKTKSSKVSIDISDIEKQIAPNDSLETVEEKGEKSTTKKKKLVFSPTISKTNNEKETDNKEENESDGIPKQGKKRFRQRARYKNKPKNEDIVKNVEGETKDEEKIEEVEDEEENSNPNDLGGFQVIGNLEFQKRKKVKRVLPEWLAKPTIISVNLKNLNSKIKDLTELDTYFKKLLRKNGVSHFFPVQSELIPYLIKQHSRKSIFWPRDVCVSAPTGSGKTLSFVLPILQLLRDRVVPQIRALVVLPTQDLASQVYSVFKTYVKGTKLQVVLTVGSTPFEEEQKKLVAWDTILQKHVSLADIVVTTPGRLVDHITNSPGFDLSCLKFLVVDEADRMIDNNDCNWLLHINKHINYQGLNSVPPLMLHTFLNYPCRPQRLLFSATLSHDPEKLHQLSLFQPKLFTSIVEGDHPTSESTNTNAMTSGFIGKFTTPAELVEKFTLCTTMTKPLVLYHLIKKHAMKGVLCFVNTTQGAHRLAKLLYHIERVTTKAVKNDAQSAKLNIAEVYSDMKLEQRNKIIQDFRRRKIDLVIASDNLARGIDVENIDVVINYEAPDNIKKYIHRIGRTARGGRQGTSVTLVTMHDKNPFLKMLSGVGKQNIEELECTEQELEHLEQVYAKAIERLKKDVEKEGEIILKIAKAQKKGKKIKKNKTLLDGTSKKNKKSNNVPNQIVDSRNEKTNTGNAGIVEPKSGASNGSDKKEKTGDGKAKNTSQKTVKRSEIKKVVKKNMNAEDKKKQFGKKNKNKFNKKKPTVQGQSVNTKGMKRNKKIKLKKLLKKQNKKPKS
uniref:ATP-dependent RNA helicase n=2 Tax=Cacopsylla melanoneura TaxID=428564 RepID=A0A8D8M1I4_9HEMI